MFLSSSLEKRKETKIFSHFLSLNVRESKSPSILIDKIVPVKDVEESEY